MFILGTYIQSPRNPKRLAALFQTAYSHKKFCRSLDSSLHSDQEKAIDIEYSIGTNTQKKAFVGIGCSIATNTQKKAIDIRHSIATNTLEKAIVIGYSIATNTLSFVCGDKSVQEP